MAWTPTYSWKSKHNALDICTPGSHNSYPFFLSMKQSRWAATPGLLPQLLGVPACTVSLALAEHQDVEAWEEALTVPGVLRSTPYGTKVSLKPGCLFKSH